MASEKAEDMCLFGREAGGVRGSLLRKGAAGVGDFRRRCSVLPSQHRGKPSLLFKLKEHMVDFLQSAHVTGLPSSLEELATCLFTKLQAGSSGGTSEQEHVSHARASQSLLDMACAGFLGWS